MTQPFDRSPRFAKCLAFACSLAALVSCGESAKQQPNVLLIVIDTLRADHLGTYGYERRETSPRIDEFATRAVRFTRAYAAAAWTRPSVASILTGLPPATHGANTIRKHLDPEVETLAESFKAAGYATAGVVSNAHLLDRIGFAQGFDRWDQTQAQGAKHISSPGVNREALSMLEELSSSSQPWFLFVHYFDPHYGYLDHASFDFAPSDAPNLDGSEEMAELEESIGHWAAADHEFVIGRYDEEIRLTDQAIGELLDRVGQASHGADTVVAITADHGEEFGDHGFVGHANLHEEVIRVPLLVQHPGREEICDVTAPVTLLSLAPTLLELSGVGFPPGRYPEAPLADCDSLAAAPRPVFSELQNQRAIIEGSYKLIIDPSRKSTQLYDLAADPREVDDLTSARPRVRRRLIQLSAANEKQMLRRETQPKEIDATQRGLLRELGYIDSDEDAPEPP